MPTFFLFFLSFFILIFFLIGAIAFVVRACQETWLLSSLNKHGSTTTGQIVSRRSSSTERGGTGCYVTYRYESEGKGYSHEQMVNRAHYHALKKDGEQVSVLYLALAPSISMLTDADRDDAEAKRYRMKALLYVSCTILFVIFTSIWGIALLGQR